MTSLASLRVAQTLGMLGLLPFFALAVLAWLPDSAAAGSLAIASLARLSLAAYAAVILSFLGAVHWGLALSGAEMRLPLARQSLLWGVMPSLLGWLALVLLFVGFAAWLVFALLIADLLLARLMDGALLRQHASNHRGYLELRTRLTVGATLALAIALAGSL
ncbi:MAG: DUF3429 domain-containing protein [Burkholderiales bacterium]|jgi:hypothetical protein|nr:DUF3429 domain-containing protein [Burkholderiales bacterium]